MSCRQVYARISYIRQRGLVKLVSGGLAGLADKCRSGAAYMGDRCGQRDCLISAEISSSVRGQAGPEGARAAAGPKGPDRPPRRRRSRRPRLGRLEAVEKNSEN
jgi:hypothetical protein